MKTEYNFTSSPWGFRYWKLEEYCGFMKELGITGICTMLGDPVTFPLAFSRRKEDCELYRKTVEEKGLHIFEAAIGDDYPQDIKLASILGAKLVRICDIWDDKEDILKKVTSMLRDAGEIASQYGITVVVENHGGLLARAAKCRQILQAVNMENVKLNYDPANFYYYGEDPLKALDVLLPFIGLVHLKSVKKENGKLKYCRVLEGVLDYSAILVKLLSAYQGYMGLEYEEPSDVKSGTIDDLQYLSELLNPKNS